MLRYVSPPLSPPPLSPLPPFLPSPPSLSPALLVGSLTLCERNKRPEGCGSHRSRWTTRASMPAWPRLPSIITSHKHTKKIERELSSANNPRFGVVVAANFHPVNLLYPPHPHPLLLPRLLVRCPPLASH